MALFAPIEITKESFEHFYALEPKRINFASTHSGALKRSEPPHVGIISLPFLESIEPVFPFRLFSSRFSGHYRSIKTENEFEDIASWISRYRDVVFIRSCMEANYALSMNMTEPGKHTEIGELEYKAKYQGCETSSADIFARMASFVTETLVPCLGVDALCAMPPSDPAVAGASFVTRMASQISEKSGLPDCSPAISWKAKKEPLKTKAFDERWSYLESVGLNVSADVREKSIVVVDDLYQSGTSIAFIASKLLSNGASRVIGLSVVKSLSDSDNG